MTIMALKEGTFEMQPTEAVVGFAKTGTEMVSVLLEHELGRIVWRGYFSEAALERTCEALEAMGWNGENVGRISFMTREEFRRVRVVIGSEVGEDGRSYLVVRFINRLASAKVHQKMTPEDIQDLNRRLRHRLIAKRDGDAPRNPIDPGASEETDDIPF
ncbi:MAG: hypothetical protein KIT41_14285 [Pyrinomonadaceae bacterium]|nr:hypothetical protein [Pyrinomonadaceae bacterium]